jgi:hypothetical protein
MTIAVALPPRRGPCPISRAATAHAVAAAKGPGFSPENVLEKLFPKDARSMAILTRAATAPATTTTSGWASQLATNDYREFLVGLQPLSAAARLIEMGVYASLGRFQTLLFPQRQGLPSILPWVGEAAPIPVSSRVLEQITLGPLKKLATISVLTNELLRRSDAAAIVEQVLREDASYSLDLAYFSTAAASSSVHAGLLNGLTPLVPTSGGGEVAARTDLAALINAVAVGGSGQVVIVTGLSRAAALPMLWNMRLDGITILGSPAVADTRLISTDPQSLLHATDPSLDISTSEGSTVHMEDSAPLGISTPGSPNTVAAPVRSLFQTDSVGLRVISQIAFAKRRSGAVAFLDNPTW